LGVRAGVALGLEVVTVVAGLTIAVRAARIDLHTHRLPNRLTAALAGVGLVGFLAASVITDAPAASGDEAIVSALLLGMALCAGPWLVSHLVAPSQIGFGDVKLSAGLGLYLGRLDPRLSILAVLAAGLWFVVEGRWRRRGSAGSQEPTGPTPFGPALVGGAVLSGATGLIGRAILG
jgi:leader peptidase (prepilin peptidase)/N-methyltransferase